MTENAERASSVSLRSVGVVTLLSFGQILLLFVMQLVLANEFGASRALDAYLSATALPLVLGGVLSGAAGAVVVPLYNEQRAARGEQAAEAAMVQVAGWLAAATVAIASGLSLGAAPLVALFYSEFDAGQQSLTSALLRIVAWLVPCNTLTGYLFGVHHARQRFFLPALVGLVGPALTIALLLFGNRSVESLAFATIWGAVLGAGVLAAGLRLTSLRQGMAAGALSRFGWLAVPLIIGAACSRLDLIVDRALAARLSEGSISQMGYASRIITSVAMLGTSGLSVVIFPSLSRHVAAGDRALLLSTLSEGWRFLAVVMIPVIAGILFCGEPIVRAVFERGAFTPTDSAAVSRMLQLYSGALAAAGIGELAGRTFVALGRTWLPTLIGMTGFALGVAAKFLIVDRWAADGLAAATSCYSLFNVGMLLAALPLVGVRRFYGGLATTVLRSAVATAIAVGVARAVMLAATPLSAIAGVFAAVVLYVLVLLLLGDEFPRRALAMLRDRSPPA